MSMTLEWPFLTFFRRRWHFSEAAWLIGTDTLWLLFYFCVNGIKNSGLFNLLRRLSHLFIWCRSKEKQLINSILL